MGAYVGARVVVAAAIASSAVAAGAVGVIVGGEAREEETEVAEGLGTACGCCLSRYIDVCTKRLVASCTALTALWRELSGTDVEAAGVTLGRGLTVVVCWGGRGMGALWTTGCTLPGTKLVVKIACRLNLIENLCEEKKEKKIHDEKTRFVKPISCGNLQNKKNKQKQT